jgi:hypothetical protein
VNRQSIWIIASLLVAACAKSSPTTDASPAAAWPTPIDPQRVRDQDLMTWDDYKPIPGVDWTDPNKKGSVKTVRLAVITADFPDQPFVMTLPKKSDLFGNPQTNPVKREDIPRFFYEFYMTPNASNHGRTIHEYWMEQSRGRIGVTTTMFGPYRMPGNVFQYGFNTQADLPTGFTTRNLGRDLDSMAQNTSISSCACSPGTTRPQRGRNSAR